MQSIMEKLPDKKKIAAGAAVVVLAAAGWQLYSVLVACCFAHSTAGIQLVKACRIVGRQLLVGNCGCQLCISSLYALVYILRVNGHQNLAGVYPVAYVDKTGSDSAGSLKGQLAFVASTHLAGIYGGGIDDAFANRHSPAFGVCLPAASHNLPSTP